MVNSLICHFEDPLHGVSILAAGCIVSGFGKHLFDGIAGIDSAGVQAFLDNAKPPVRVNRAQGTGIQVSAGAETGAP